MKNFGVYPISLLGDLCNVAYAVKIEVLTTNYQYVQYKYTKYKEIRSLVIKNIKRKHNSNFKVLLQVQKSEGLFLLLPSPLPTTI